MRITAGQLRGRSVHCPPGLDVRPTSAKVRQAFFNILGTRIVGANFLDVFAGSGLIGFEALSRGASSVVFGEEAARQGRAIKQTIEMFDAATATAHLGEAQLILGDFRRLLANLKSQNFDLIFVDPPYKMRYGTVVLELVEKYDLLAPGGMVIIEHIRGDVLPEFSPDGNLVKCDYRLYGQTALAFYQAIDQADVQSKSDLDLGVISGEAE